MEAYPLFVEFMKNKIADLKLGFLLNELILFAAVQVAGLYCGYRLFQTMKGISDAATFSDDNPFISFSFLVGFLVATALYFFFIKKVKRKMPFHIFFSFLLFYGSLLAFRTFLSETGAFIGAFSAVLLRYRIKNILVHNISLMLAVIGLGTVLGIGIAPWQVALILAVLSVYDYVAVYKTKHMVTMFRGLMEKGIIMAMIIPSDPRSLFSEAGKARPGESFVFLGSGDLAFPMIFSISALIRGIHSSVMIIAGAALGMAALHFYLAARKDHKPAPALPPIAGGAILGYLLSLLF